MKKNLIAIAALTLSAGFSMAQTVVTIAHVGPTSGGIAHLGKDNENGAIMAVEELNAAGVTIGGKKVTLKLMTEDDAADPKHRPTWSWPVAVAWRRGRRAGAR